jgi:gluconolactonase
MRMTRRDFARTLGASAGLATAAVGGRHFFGRFEAALRAQAPSSPVPPGRVNPPSVVSNPPRDFTPGAAPVTYPDPDVIVLDASFNGLRLFNAPIQRLWTGGLWLEGPAWCGQGRYLVWSDIPNDRQMRYLDDDGRVTVFRSPSNHSNGNTFDVQGRQLSCEHSGRRVVRYEHDGSVTVIADSYEGKRLNSPNDVAVHQDGSIWFTDPPFGGSLYEGRIDAAGGPGNPQGRLNARLGVPVAAGDVKRELPNNVYRVGADGRVTLVIDQDILGSAPNGIAFSPDYRKLYVVARGGVVVGDISARSTVASVTPFSNFTVDGVRCGPDGIRADVYGNLWCSSNAGNNVGYSGVTVHSPDGRLIGRIRLPEVCANITFGGARRNRLFMAAGQSLYALYVNTQGAASG